MGDVIRFPKPVVELTEEEYTKFVEYKEKMHAAKTKAEFDFYCSQIRILIEHANQRG
ncbi:hypothetical protein ABXV20_27580 [Bacillus paranthracis]|uniref:hypothetical protein n=1 Tax=Bacillus paranthracis TaxID=2026186 RepID=UPI0016466229